MKRGQKIFHSLENTSEAVNIPETAIINVDVPELDDLPIYRSIQSSTENLPPPSTCTKEITNVNTTPSILMHPVHVILHSSYHGKSPLGILMIASQFIWDFGFRKQCGVFNNSYSSGRWTPFTGIASPLAVSKRYFSSVSCILQCATMFGLTIV
ncbi:hypothetical protein NQ315_017357 [Exocentrus adspersus]|uniref:Uncharacterized protein n=1 Tax=Exocentrus adspersus TaxID=1586481 RepID=A0AAV8VL31_9CUCU|nr:hypothetical protein NQ315_017357 [Exocentrus adspersus]